MSDCKFRRNQQDELFDQAVRIIIKANRGSVSLLQRSLGIGYARAFRLIELMTEKEIVGGFGFSQTREVLMSLAEYELTVKGDK